MYEWISIIMVIKFEGRLDIKEYENNLKQSKAIKMTFNSRELFLNRFLKISSALCALVFIGVKMMSVQKIMNGDLVPDPSIKRLENIFIDSEFDTEMNYNTLNPYSLILVIFYGLYIICISRMILLMKHHRERAYK